MGVDALTDECGSGDRECDSRQERDRQCGEGDLLGGESRGPDESHDRKQDYERGGYGPLHLERQQQGARNVKANQMLVRYSEE